MRFYEFSTGLLFVAFILSLQGSWAASFPLVTRGDGDRVRPQHIVLISGDEEYRSEEALPQLAKILSYQHGFRCTTLFSVHPDLEVVHPNHQNNIPGLESLRSADLMIIFTRFRALPAQQMRYIDEYLRKGRPVIGIRTATHAFEFPQASPWHHYSNSYKGPRDEWEGGFGRRVLGERWVSHHGEHKHESTRGVVTAPEHPIARGLSGLDIWGPTDVYAVRLPLPKGREVILRGHVVERAGPFLEDDLFFGMRPSDSRPVAEKNSPSMPIAWAGEYSLAEGTQGRAFTSTLGASVDLLSEGTRRLLVQAAYWALGLEEEIPPEGCSADVEGVFQPSAYGFHSDEYWEERSLRPWR